METGEKNAGTLSDENVATRTSLLPYEPPRLRHLGSVRALTLGGTGGAGDRTSRSGARTSTREAKDDIRYLTTDERSRLAREVLGLKLATYEYKPEAGEAPGRHLGFILEDAPDAPFVRKDEKVVDVYGFAAGLAAVVQEQQETIRRLEREIAELRKTNAQ